MPENEDAAALSSGQDDGKVAAGGAAARQQDSTRRLPGDLVVGASASPGWHASRRDGRAAQAREVGG